MGMLIIVCLVFIIVVLLRYIRKYKEYCVKLSEENKALRLKLKKYRKLWKLTLVVSNILVNDDGGIKWNL